MELLPKDHVEFSTENYWNDFFAKLKSKSFEWYGEYDTLCDILDKYVRMRDKLLIVGCGNSRLSADLYDMGIRDTVSIDISSTVIKQMKEKYLRDRPDMKFEKMDVFSMSFEDEIFGVVLDKGTLDALLVDKTEDTDLKINQMFSELGRVLRYGGRYICISLLQEHVIQKLLDWFTDQGWMVRIHRCHKADSKDTSSISFPVFVAVFTKMKKLSTSSMIIEVVHDVNSAPKRLNSKEEAIEFVKSAQHYAFLKHYISKKKLDDEDICLEVCSSDSGATKYKIYIVDQKKTFPTKFAVFIVPQGRETEWHFSTPDGRQELAATANCERLIVVHLLRNVVYENLAAIKKDISETVMGLAPLSLKSQVQILSLGGDVGCREIRCADKSDISGEYIVEDVTSENEVFRRLVFLNNSHLVQSEARLIRKHHHKRKKRNVLSLDLEIDFKYLACEHHALMIAGLTFLKSEMLNPKILQIGLGGGCLAMYLYKHFLDATIDAVELDSPIVDVAKKWFGLIVDERLSVKIANGITFIQESTKGYYDIIMIDVDSKDSSLGMSSPPPEFLEEKMVDLLLEIIQENGVVIINLSCRSSKLHGDAIALLKSKFKCVYLKEVPNEVNTVVYCVKQETADSVLSNVITNAARLKTHLTVQTKGKSVFDDTLFVKSLKRMTL